MKTPMEIKIEQMLSILNERQQRIYLASEGIALGRGGFSEISRISGVSRPTILSGKKELEKGITNLPQERIRKPGGGRKKIYLKNPKIISELDKLVDPLTRGDPESPLRWTCKSTRNLAKELSNKGFKVSHVYVAELLSEMGYSLQANRKVNEGGNHPDRNRQFHYINNHSQSFLLQNLPVISVDTKKKELVGNYKNNGKTWEQAGEPTEVEVYDFINAGKDKAVPYGIYDIGKNEGFVNVGMSYDTSSFAVSSIRRWWIEMGKTAYPKAKKLMITADGGGSNGYRRKQWKTELQKFCDEFKLEIMVLHFSPGTSKWNKIEHRLFSHISMNWRGRPIISFETIVNLIGSNTTSKGLKVKSMLDETEYPKGVVVPKEELEMVNLFPHRFHGEWNYTIKPKRN
ncbi:MAG: ISAzo13 family transposase [Bacteroidales bacterium]|nr:ISAzo13 family transposase [Bacteroidales bacterium]